MEVHSFPYSLPVSNQTIALRTAFNTLSRLRDLKEAWPETGHVGSTFSDTNRKSALSAPRYPWGSASSPPCIPDRRRPRDDFRTSGPGGSVLQSPRCDSLPTGWL